jgi:tetratricopeptide (TPR) repeat protein
MYRILFLVISLHLFSPLLAQDEYTWAIENLSNMDPKVRESAAILLGQKRVKTAVWPLIARLQDEDEAVRIAAATALQRITRLGRGYAMDYKLWNQWWEREGHKDYPIEVIKRVEIEPLREEVSKLRTDVQKLKGELYKAERDVRTSMIAILILAVLFLLIMIYFTGVSASRLKAWKEAMKQTEVYVQKGNELTRHMDKITDELNGKKGELLEFQAKIREESQNEFERFCELMQSNLEHRMRESSTELRARAEAEIEDIFSQLRTQITHELRREFMERETRLLKEVEAEKLFIEGLLLIYHRKPLEALKLFNRVLGIKPDYVLALEYKGNALRSMRRYDEALDSYQHALELQPENPSALYNTAITYAELKKRDKVLEYLSKAFQNNGDYKEEAINDSAFKEYWYDPAFKELTEA